MPQKQPEKNMCDGCQRGLPLKGRDHYTKEGRIVMGCTKDRYIAKLGKKCCCKKCEDWSNDSGRQCAIPNCKCHIFSQPPVSEWEKSVEELHELTVEIQACIYDICRTDNKSARVAKDNLSNIFNEKIKSMAQSVRNQTLEQAIQKIEKEGKHLINSEFILDLIRSLKTE